MKKTTFSVALIVAVTLIFSGSIAAVNQTNSTNMNAKSTKPLQNWISTATVNMPNKEGITQVQPAPLQPTDWIHYDDGTNVNSIGLTAGGAFEYGVRFTPTELSGFDGYELTTVRHHHGWESSTAPSVSGDINIYDEGTSTSPGTLLHTQTYTTLDVPGWEEYTLTSPVTIDESKDIWVTLTVTHLAGEYPAGCGPGPMVMDKGGFITLDGTTWDQIGLLGLDYNWNMWAGLEEGGGPTDHDVGVQSINAPVSGPAGVITPEVTVKNYGNNSETTDVQLTIGQFAPPVTLLSEDFESGLPGTWTVVDGGTSSDTWTDTNPCARAGTGGCSGTFMIADSDCAGSGPTMYEELISPSFDCSVATQVLLDYSFYYWHLSSAAYVDVWDGTSWTNVKTYTGTTTGPEVGLDISSIAAGKSDVKIRFTYDDMGAWAWYWMVDNVVVYQLGGLVNEYDETETVTLDIGESEDVQFDDWTPDDWQSIENVDITYQVVAKTLLVDDNPANDQKSSSVTLNYPYLHDIAVISIDEPSVRGPAQTLPVEVTIKNVGQFEECCYQTNVQIGEKVYTNA